MLIHSRFRLGRGTPHRPRRSVTVHPRQRWNERLAGNYRRPWPPGLGTLKSQILSCSNTNSWETEVQRSFCVDISIHYPVPEAGNPRPHLSHTLAPPQRGNSTLPSFSPHFPPAAASQAWASCMHPPPHPDGYQKCPGRMSKILELFQRKSLFLAFFLLNSED